MKNITKGDILPMKADLAKTLEAFEAKWGVKVELGSRVKYDSTRFDFELTVKAESAGTESDDFAKYAPLYGLKPEDYGRIIPVNGRAFKLIGFEPSRPKFAIKALDCKSGKPMLLATSTVGSQRGW